MQSDTTFIPAFFGDYSDAITTRDGHATAVHYVQQHCVEKVKVSLDTHLVVLLRSGSKDLYHHSGKVTVSPGEGFFLKKGQYLMSEKPQGEMPYESFLIFFNDQFALNHLRHLANPSPQAVQAGCDLVRIGDDPRITEFGTSLRQYFPVRESKDFLSSMLTIKIQELVQLLMVSETTPDFRCLFQRLHDPLTVKIRDLMEKHYMDNLSLEQLAFLAGYSLSTFKRKFQQVYGQPPGRWVTDRKLQEAFTMLATTGLTVSEICYTCGFESPSHFVQAFRHKFGNTPAQYRQELLAS